MVKQELSVLIHLASSDGLVAEKEARLIKAVGEANNMDKDEVEALIKTPDPIGNLKTLSDDQKFEYLYNVVQLMKADGQVFKSEIAFCENVAEKLGYKRKVIGELSSRIYSDPSITGDRELIKAKAQKLLIK